MNHTRIFLSPSVLVLIFVNLLPLWGVLRGGWGLFEVMAMFWAENVVIMALNLAKLSVLAFLKGDKAAEHFLLKFAYFYALAGLAHGFFLLAMFGPGGVGDPAGNQDDEFAKGIAILMQPGFMIPALAMGAGHIFSFLFHFLWREEFKTVTAQALTKQPHKRIVILHITILFGGFCVAVTGNPVNALIVLIALKSCFDVAGHVIEQQHQRKTGSLRMDA